VTIKGQRVSYRATAGNQPVWDSDGRPIASVFYVYYERSDIRDRATRPLVISFNGGPGSASVWMHIGYTGRGSWRSTTRGSRSSRTAYATIRTPSSMSPTSFLSIL
jgi:carboxypeptidase C (cathepsin A)